MYCTVGCSISGTECDEGKNAPKYIYGLFQIYSRCLFVYWFYYDSYALDSIRGEQNNTNDHPMVQSQIDSKNENILIAILVDFLWGLLNHSMDEYYFICDNVFSTHRPDIFWFVVIDLFHKSWWQQKTTILLIKQYEHRCWPCIFDTTNHILCINAFKNSWTSAVSWKGC